MHLAIAVIFLLLLVPKLCFSGRISARQTQKCCFDANSEKDLLFKSFEGLVRPFLLEQHFVQTEDGYILRLFRIKSPSINYTNSEKVVYLQHGLLDSSAGFVLLGSENALAFILAKQGYDVWLGNSRGNTFSRSHAWLDPGSDLYWRFTWDEMAQYDLPTSLQYVISSTGARKLAYVGHSQGTTIMLAALTQTPWLADTLSVAVLLAPVAMAGHMTSVPLLAMAAMNTDRLFAELGIREFLPSRQTASRMEGGLCRLQPWMCVSFLTALCGFNPNNLNTTALPAYLAFTPAGTSVRNMAHWAQAVRSETPNSMARFDFGNRCVPRDDRLPTCNRDAYGTDSSPVYDLTSIRKANLLALFMGDQDRLATPLDDEFLLESLRPGVVHVVQRDAQYEHLDYIWGKDASQRVYRRVLELIEERVLEEVQEGKATESPEKSFFEGTYAKWKGRINRSTIGGKRREGTALRRSRKEEQQI